MHYSPRKCSAVARMAELVEQAKHEARAARDAEYRAALGVAAGDELPKVLGQAEGHGHVPRGGGRIRESRPGVSVPEARHGH